MLSRARDGPWRRGVEVPHSRALVDAEKEREEKKEEKSGGGGEGGSLGLGLGCGAEVDLWRGKGWPRGPPGGGGLCLRCCLSAGRYRGDDGVSGLGCCVGCAAVGGRWAVTACLPTAVWFYFSFSFFLNPFSFLIFVENRKGKKERDLRVCKMNLIFMD